jgi:hypothetical protein
MLTLSGFRALLTRLGPFQFRQAIDFVGAANTEGCTRKSSLRRSAFGRRSLLVHVLAVDGAIVSHRALTNVAVGVPASLLASRKAANKYRVCRSSHRKGGGENS